MVTAYRPRFLLALTIGASLGAFNALLVTPAAVGLGQNFGLGADGLSSLLFTYLLAFAAGAILLDWTVGDGNRRYIFLLSAATVALGSVLVPLAGAISSFIPLVPPGNIFQTGRVLQAVGGGGLFVLSLSFIIDSFPEERRWPALKSIAYMNLAGFVLGAVLGSSWLSLGWEMDFILSAGLAVLVLYIGLNLPDSPQRAWRPFSWPSRVYYGVGLYAFMSGLSRLVGIFLYGENAIFSGLIFTGLGGWIVYTSTKGQLNRIAPWAEENFQVTAPQEEAPPKIEVELSLTEPSATVEEPPIEAGEEQTPEIVQTEETLPIEPTMAEAELPPTFSAVEAEPESKAEEIPSPEILAFDLLTATEEELLEESYQPASDPVVEPAAEIPIEEEQPSTVPSSIPTPTLETEEVEPEKEPEIHAVSPVTEKESPPAEPEPQIEAGPVLPIESTGEKQPEKEQPAIATRPVEAWAMEQRSRWATITDFSLRRRSVVILLLILTTFGGTWSSFNLNTELLPDLNLPVASVLTIYPGTAPKTVLDDITVPVENAIAGTKGLKSIQSISEAGVSMVVAEFEFGTNMRDAVAAMNQNINAITLPQEAQAPKISEINLDAMPIVRLSLIGGDDLASLQEIAEKEIEPLLSGIDGVQAVQVVGGSKKQIEVLLDAGKMADRRVSASQVGATLKASNISIPSGDITEKEREVPIITSHKLTSLKEIEDLVIMPGGAPGGTSGMPRGLERESPEEEPVAIPQSLAEAEPTGGTEYVVQSGDTLSAIAQRFYGDANQYGRIFDANRDQLSNPNLIQPGQKLRIPPAQTTQPQPTRTPAPQVSPTPRPSTPVPATTTVVSASPTAQPSSPTAPPSTNTARPTTPGTTATNTAQPRAATPAATNTAQPRAATPAATNTSQTPVTSPSATASTVATAAVTPSPRSQATSQPTKSPSPAASPKAAPSATASVVGAITPETSPTAKASPTPSRTPTATPTPPSSSTLRLRDIGQVRLTDASNASVSRTNGKPSIGILVFKTSDSNTVKIADEVAARIDSVKPVLGSIEVVTISDQSTYIKESIDGLIRESLMGAGFAVLVIFLFLLSLRSTLVAAISIPISVLMALVALNWQNMTLNIMTLGGLAVAIGRVVDDSIVVLENIYRHVREGQKIKTAAHVATSEVAAAITISTLTTVAVFLPLAFIKGVVGQVFTPFALTVTYALLASLVVALTLVPVLSTLFIGSTRAKPEKDNWLQRIYTPVIRWSLRHRIVTLLVATILVGISLALLPLVGTTFLPTPSEKQIQVRVELPPGSDLKTTQNATEKVETVIEELPDRQVFHTTIGNTGSLFGVSGFGLGNSATADIYIRLNPDAEVSADAEIIRGRTEDAGNNASVSVSAMDARGMGTSKLEVVISGDSESVVEAYARQVEEVLRQVDGLENVESDISAAKPEISVKVNPEEAIKKGLTPAQIGLGVREMVAGQVATRVDFEDRTMDVSVRVRPEDTQSVDKLKSLRIGTINPAPLSEIAEVKTIEGPVRITRRDRTLAVTVSGAITKADTGTVTQSAREAVASLQSPNGIEVQYGGIAEQQTEGFSSLGIALLVAVGLVYIVMVATMGSLLEPLIILISLPLASIGAILSLYLTGRTLGMSALIGLLMLIGIVVTNAVVLLDLVRRLRARGMPVREALVEGGRTRIRPILMTAIATILALTPLALGFGRGSIIAAELATVVIGGLLTSTLLTLIIVPVVYSILIRDRRSGDGD